MPKGSRNPYPGDAGFKKELNPPPTDRAKRKGLPKVSKKSIVKLTNKFAQRGTTTEVMPKFT